MNRQRERVMVPSILFRKSNSIHSSICARWCSGILQWIIDFEQRVGKERFTEMMYDRTQVRNQFHFSFAHSPIHIRDFFSYYAHRLSIQKLECPWAHERLNGRRKFDTAVTRNGLARPFGNESSANAALAISSWYFARSCFMKSFASFLQIYLDDSMNCPFDERFISRLNWSPL